MKAYFCVGSYTEDILFGTGETYRGKGKGVTVCFLEDGKITKLSSLKIRNPSFLALNEKDRKIYAVNETKEFRGKYGGGLSILTYGADGSLTEEKAFNTCGSDPCHAAVSVDKKWLAVANYGGGSVSFFRIEKKGEVKDAPTVFEHYGSGPDPARQKEAHAHCSAFSPDGKYLYVTDLGTDVVKAYRLKDDGIYSDPFRDIRTGRGSGPRCACFDREGRNLYVTEELKSGILWFRKEKGGYLKKKEYPSCPSEFMRKNSCADLHISPDGKHLYASNRGHDSIAHFFIRPDGSLVLERTYESGGKTPRNFAIDPSGEWLLAGNQDSNGITVFKISTDGSLIRGKTCCFGSPVCIRFFRKGNFKPQVL